MSGLSKITISGKIAKSKDLVDVPTGTAFTGRLMGLYGSPYGGVFLKQSRSLVGLGITTSSSHKLLNLGNVFFDNDKGTIEDYQVVDLEITAVPHVS